MRTYAVDFETFYDKECNIKTLGLHRYINHPKFDAYLVAVCGDDGYKFVGHPQHFNWDILHNSRVVSHNAIFDRSIYELGVIKGFWPNTNIIEWLCSLELCKKLNIPCSLKNAIFSVYGIKISKQTRTNMSGQVWSKMPPEFKDEVIEYAYKDAELCLRLWLDLHHSL